MAHDVFVCYSSEDKTIANAACAKLESAGIRCWIAPRDPIAGIPYGRQLVDAITAARVVLLIFSGNANRSEHVLRELEVASDGGKIIVPFRIENVVPSGDLKYYITRVHWLDAMSPPMEARLNELVTLMQRLLDLPIAAAPPSPAVRPRRKLSAYYIAAAAVVILAVAAAFAFGFNRPSPAATHVVAKATTRPKKAAPKATPAHAVMVAAQPTPRVIYVAATSAPVVIVPKHAVMRARSTPAARAPAPRTPAPIKTIAPTVAPVVQTRAPTLLTYHLPRGIDIQVSRVSAASWRIGNGGYYTTAGRADIDGTSGTTLSSPNGREWLFIPDLGASGPYAHQICFSTAGPGLCDANKIFSILSEQ